MTTEHSNRLEITGRILEMDALRRTPAGLPVLGFKLEHRSRQIEAGHPRDVEVEMQALALGEVAKLLSGTKLDGWMRVTGFLAVKSAKSRQPVLHVTDIEFLEGN